MSDPFDLTAGWLEEHLLIPALYQFGLMNWEDVSYGWALFAVYGAVQVVVTFAVCLPLEHWRPVERWPDNKAVLVDIAYTVVSRVGILPFVTYVLFYRAQVSLSGWVTDQGWVPPTLEGLFPLLLGQHVPRDHTDHPTRHDQPQQPQPAPSDRIMRRRRRPPLARLRPIPLPTPGRKAATPGELISDSHSEIASAVRSASAVSDDPTTIAFSRTIPISPSPCTQGEGRGEGSSIVKCERALV